MQICPNGGHNDVFWKTSIRKPFVMTIRLGLMDFKNNFLRPSLRVQKRFDRSYGTQKASPREIVTQICPNGSQNDIFFSSKALHQARKTNTHGLDKNYVLSGFQKFQKRFGRSYRAQKASSCGIVTQICPNGSHNYVFRQF